MENDHLRRDMRVLTEKFKNMYDEKEHLMSKIQNYKKLRRESEEDLRRKVRSLEEQNEKLVNALKKLKDYEGKMLHEHTTHLESRIQMLESELKKYKGAP